VSGPAAFEAHGLSGLDALSPATRFECGVCWRVYDPAEGCDYWQAPPGTPFAALPEHWTCPNCDTPREKFVPLDRAPADLATRLATLSADYQRAADTHMAGLPVVNPALCVETIGFRDFGEDWLGLVITPWFMNITLLPADIGAQAARRDGETMTRALPAGEFEFVFGRLPNAGPVWTCSLFSPMAQFASHEAARETALAALAALFNARIDAIDTERAPSAPMPAADRRALIFGRSAKPPEATEDA